MDAIESPDGQHRVLGMKTFQVSVNLHKLGCYNNLQK